MDSGGTLKRRPGLANLSGGTIFLLPSELAAGRPYLAAGFQLCENYAIMPGSCRSPRAHDRADADSPAAF
jgi:hypothetical protein